MAFGIEHATVYEAVYRARGKDWEREARSVVDRVRAFRPAAKSLLDVACGTGAHLSTFAGAFDHVEGLDIAPAMLDLARRRLPDVSLHLADMRSFDLGARFDVVTCLYTAIAYVEDEEQMREAIRVMARHLVPGGMMIVEPWWLPEHYLDQYVGGDMVRTDDGVIARVSRTTADGNRATMVVEWVVGAPGELRRFTEVETFAMFSVPTFLDAFEAAGCRASYEPESLGGFGLFQAVRI